MPVSGCLYDNSWVYMPPLAICVFSCLYYAYEKHCFITVDSDRSALREINIIFPDFDAQEWYQSAEPMYRNGEVEFCTQRNIHIIKSRH